MRTTTITSAYKAATLNIAPTYPHSLSLCIDGVLKCVQYTIECVVSPGGPLEALRDAVLQPQMALLYTADGPICRHQCLHTLWLMEDLKC